MALEKAMAKRRKPMRPSAKSITAGSAEESSTTAKFLGKEIKTESVETVRKRKGVVGTRIVVRTILTPS
jgi:hypothetical protein